MLTRADFDIVVPPLLRLCVDEDIEAAQRIADGTLDGVRIGA